MVALLTTGDALDLFKSRVTLKQMEGRIAPKVYQYLQEAESLGSNLVLVIPDAKLNRQATALLEHWIPTALDDGLTTLLGLIPTTVGYEKPAEPPTVMQLVENILKPIKAITDTYHKPEE